MTARTRLIALAEWSWTRYMIGSQTGGRVTFFLRTDNFWRDYRRMKEIGIEFVRDPVVASYGTVAVFKDLYGNLWDLVGPTIGEGVADIALVEAG